jgi:GT2 family glycosyltransferase
VAPASEIDVSVVVPAYRSDATLATCVESLLAQRFGGGFEIVVVASADTPEGLPALPSHAALKVVEQTPRRPAATARNAGVAHASGRSIAFTDADVIVPPDWLERLSAASAGGWCVAGSVVNGTPESAWGTVEYLVEFFDLSPARPHPPLHGATCNLLIPRPVWEAHGPFAEGMEGCEDTLLTTRLREEGLLRFAPEARVTHLNRQGPGAVLAHQRAKGATHARLAVALGDAPATPVLDGLRSTARRVAYLYRRVAAWTPSDLGRSLRLAPLVLTAFGAWGLGLIAESRRLR